MAEERILVVDDEYLIRWTLQQNLEKENYEVLLAETGEEALEKAEKDAPDLALIDLKLPGMDGFEVLERILKINRDIVPIMITAYDDVERVVRAIKSGAFDYITKPFDFNKVFLSIKKGLQASQLKREVKLLRQEQKSHFSLDNLIFVSPVMEEVIRITERIAQSDASTVLVHG
jgi:DNA-binding NtrC family response regulator